MSEDDSIQDSEPVSSFVADLKRKIKEHITRRKEHDEFFKHQSDQLMAALSLSNEELDALQEIQPEIDSFQKMSAVDELIELGGFAKVDGIQVNDKKYNVVLRVVDNLGPPHSSETKTWEKAIMAICTNDKSINETSGVGTQMINTLPTEVHKALIQHIQYN